MFNLVNRAFRVIIRKLIYFKFKVLYLNVKIAKNTHIHYTCCIHGNVKIGKNCIIHKGVILDAQDGYIDIGDFVSINPYSIAYGSGGIVIKDHTRIAAHTMIISETHIVKMGELIRLSGTIKQPVEIGKNVWIGAGVKILGNTKIGDNVVVGSNSLVNKELMKNAVYVGSPVKLLKKITK